jgi:hypothetical protein
MLRLPAGVDSNWHASQSFGTDDFTCSLSTTITRHLHCFHSGHTYKHRSPCYALQHIQIWAYLDAFDLTPSESSGPESNGPPGWLTLTPFVCGAESNAYGLTSTFLDWGRVVLPAAVPGTCIPYLSPISFSLPLEYKHPKLYFDLTILLHSTSDNYCFSYILSNLSKPPASFALLSPLLPPFLLILLSYRRTVLSLLPGYCSLSTLNHRAPAPMPTTTTTFQPTQPYHSMLGISNYVHGFFSSPVCLCLVFQCGNYFGAEFWCGLVIFLIG